MAAKRGDGRRQPKRGGGEIVSQQVTFLGEELRSIRLARGLTLRAVEEMTDISNAYLSQLETGKIDRPNPNFLFKLSSAYRVPYDMLMQKAGYIAQIGRDQGAGVAQPRTLPGAALATMEDLTSDEAQELMRYLAFLRSKRSGRQPG